MNDEIYLLPMTAEDETFKYYRIDRQKVEIIYNQVDEAISVMKEVAQWGRERGLRVWLDEWLTPEELITEEAKPENFCIGKVDGKTACAFILQNSDFEYWKDSFSVQALKL